MLKEIWLEIIIVRQLHQITELWSVWEGLHQAGQNRSVIISYTLWKKINK